jgi:hypothetical protein
MHYRLFMVIAVCVATIVGVWPAWANAQAAPGAAVSSGGAASTEVPNEVLPYGNDWVAKGSGALRFFGFKAYDATLWVTSAQMPFSFSRPFALDIRYATAVTAKDISNTSLIELQRISTSSPEQIAAWSAFMDSVFVDVKSGDRLTGVHLPSAGVRFFHNGKLIGDSPDVAFSEAFFKIWLDPKTKRKDLRNALLALSSVPRSP